MPDLVTPLTTALLAHLSADSAVQALLGNPVRLFDHRPVQAVFPYLVLAQMEGRDGGAKTVAAQTLLLTLQLFSRQRSGAEARQIMAAVRDRLHDAGFAVSGGTLVRCQEEFISILPDADSGGSQAVARYRVVVSV